MSFLLEALRKSENQKHRGQVPTIHSTNGLEFAQRKGVNPGLILLVLLPAVIVVSWYSWQHFKQPVGENANPVQTLEPATTIAAPESETPETRQSGAAATLPETPRRSVLNDPPRPGRTAVESYSEPVAELTRDDAAPGRTVLNGNAESVPGGAPGRQVPVVRVSADDETDPDHSADVVDSPVVTDSGTSVTTQQPVDQETHFSVITYWRLPQSIREEVPLPRISVLVYAERPQDRFILMGGSRFVEGDEVRPGMVLENIRRDGAVFSYRLYHFLVAQ